MLTCLAPYRGAALGTSVMIARRVGLRFQRPSWHMTKTQTIIPARSRTVKRITGTFLKADLAQRTYVPDYLLAAGLNPVHTRKCDKSHLYAEYLLGRE